MIIQRISKGIKEQDWFVVAVEVMIVVVGIFIGLQVDDWNDERKDRAREHLLLGYMIEDLREEIKVIENSKKMSENRVTILTKIIEKINNI